LSCLEVFFLSVCLTFKKEVFMSISTSFRFSILVTLLVAICPAYAMFKCVAPDGKISFQDKACPGKGEVIQPVPARGELDKSKPRTTGTNQSRQDATENLRQERLQRERDSERAALSSQLSQTSAACAQDQSRMRESLSNATNQVSRNRDQLITQEMMAAATLCKAKLNTISSRIDRLQ
jgi:hypothetical protein